MKELSGADLGVVAQHAGARDLGDGEVAAVLAEQQVLAIRRVGDAAVATAGILVQRHIVLQDPAGAGVEHLDGLRRAQGEDRGGVAARIGVERDRLGADPDAQVDLRARGGDDLAVADDKGAVRLRAGDVGREGYGLGGERGDAQARGQEAGERP